MWEVNDDASSNENSVATMEVNGSVSEIEVGADLKEIVLQTARDAGYGKFRLFINEEEVQPQNAPATIEAGVAYKVVPYDVAG